MNFHGINNILVIKLRHIGDVLLTAPVFRALRENFPRARLTALVNSGTEEGLLGNPLIDEVIAFNRNIKQRNIWQQCLQEWSFLRRIRKSRFDLSVDLTSSDRAAITSYLSGARYRLGSDLSRVGFRGKTRLYTHLARNTGHQHMVLQNLAVVRQVAIDTDNLAVDFFIPEEARSFVKKLFADHEISGRDSVVHIHPTSRWFFKCWRDEGLAEVMVWLLEQGVKVIVTSAPGEKELNRARNIISLMGNGAQSHSLVDLCGQTNLKQLGAISQAADLFLGVDSAPMHIAAAVGTPVIALFGPSRAYRWAPWSGARDFPRTEEEFARRYVNGCYYLNNHVIIQRQWDCFPCGKDGCNGSKQSKCLEDISVQEVKGLLLARIPEKE